MFSNGVGAGCHRDGRRRPDGARVSGPFGGSAAAAARFCAGAGAGAATSCSLSTTGYFLYPQWDPLGGAAVAEGASSEEHELALKHSRPHKFEAKIEHAPAAVLIRFCSARQLRGVSRNPYCALPRSLPSALRA